MEIGQNVELDITAIAHGGHCIARYEGRVIFVRHAIPGERVKARITDITSSFARADCIEVITPSPDRITPQCSYAHADGCGGCDFQHISLPHQRRLKEDVIKEQFARIAKMDISVQVTEVKPTDHWRTRMEFNVSPNRKIAMFASRSNKLIEIEKCEIADSRIDITALNSRKLPLGKKVDVVCSDDQDPTILFEDRENFDLISHDVNGRIHRLNPRTFWQSHRSAATTLASVVREMCEVRPADHVYDLYGGAGLFTGELLKDLGPEGRITLIEVDDNAITDARRNFAEDGNVEIVGAKVERALRNYVKGDVVLLDPPRSGAGEKVVEAIVAMKPRTIVYVSCDPASLARDSRYLADRGYQLDRLEAFDLFPMTHHIECVARFMPAK